MTTRNEILLEQIMGKKLGAVDPKNFPNEEFDLYSIPAFDSRSPDVVTGGEIGSTKQVVQPGDVLLSKIVPHIRRAWVVAEKNGRRQIASSEWIVFRGKNVYPDYLKHILVSDPFHVRFMSTVSGVGGSLMRARPMNVAKLTIPLPDLAEQKRIAAILDKADAIRRKRQQALALTDDLLRSTFLDMFGDPVSNPKGWEEVAITKVFDVRDGTHDTPSYTFEGYPLVTSKNLLPSGLDFRTALLISEEDHTQISKRSRVDKGDILFGMIGTLGNATIVETDREFSIKNVGLFKPTAPNLTEYLWALLRDEGFFSQLLRQKKGGTQKFISLGMLRDIIIPLPAEQYLLDFIRAYNSIADLRQKLAESCSGSEQAFKSCLQRAFRGVL